MDASSVFNVLFALLAIIALVIGCGYFTRRFVVRAGRSMGRIRVIASAPLGSRERLVVVDIMGEQKLVGVTPQQITDLGVLSAPLAEPDVAPDFSATLGNWLKRSQ